MENCYAVMPGDRIIELNGHLIDEPRHPKRRWPGGVPSSFAGFWVHRIFFQLSNLPRNAENPTLQRWFFWQHLEVSEASQSPNFWSSIFLAFWSSLKISGCSKNMEQHDLPNSGLGKSPDFLFFLASESAGWTRTPKEWDDFKATWDAVKQHGPTGGAV